MFPKLDLTLFSTSANNRSSGAVRRRPSERAIADGDVRFLRKHWFRLLGICLFLSSALTASCSVSAPTRTSTTTTIDTTESAVVPPASTADVAVNGVDANEPLRDSLSSKPAIFRYRPTSGVLMIPDPTIESSANGFLFADVYSGLTRPSLLVPDEIEADLAESYVISPDGLEYTFRLRDGAKFSDGAPVTIHDVKWSWERALRPETRSVRATEVLGMIVGAHGISAGLANELVGFTAVDDVTFTVRLERPHADFLWLLTDPVASVLKPVNAETWATGVDWATGYSPRG